MKKNYLENLALKIARNISPMLPGAVFNTQSFKKNNFNRSVRSIVVSITTRCNFNCPHCLRQEVDNNKSLIRDIDLGVFETILIKAKKIGFNFVSITGGEPILHPEFTKILELIRKYGFSFNFVTNGFLYKNYWPAIKKYKKFISTVFVSVDGPDAERHDFFRKKIGSYARAVEAVRFFSSKGMHVTINFIATDESFKEIEKMAQMGISLKADDLKIIAALGNNKNFKISLNRRDEALKELLRVKKIYENKINIQHTIDFNKAEDAAKFLSCRFLLGHNIFIDHDGGMLMCCDIYKKCEDKPLVGEVGFEKAYLKTMDTVNNIKKKLTLSIIDGSIKQYATDEKRICDFCNDNVETCMSED